jgi:hypothetical protein
MAVNLIDSQDITITQTDNDIQLNVLKDSSTSTSSTKPVENQAITNYVDTEIATLQQEIDALSTSSEWTSLGNTTYYKKVGNVVCVRGYSLNEVVLTANDYKVLGTLPTGVRPTMQIGFPWALVGEGEVGIGRINTNGTIELFSTTAPSYWAFTITFII